MARVRVLNPGVARALGIEANAGDVVEVDEDLHKGFLVATAGEDTDDPVGSYSESDVTETGFRITETSPQELKERVAMDEAGITPATETGVTLEDEQVREERAEAESEVAPPAVTSAPVRPEAEDVEAVEAEEATEGPDETDDFGTGEYEGRTNAQLRALAASRGLPTGGSKTDLIERLRG